MHPVDILIPISRITINIKGSTKNIRACAHTHTSRLKLVNDHQNIQLTLTQFGTIKMIYQFA